MAIAPSQARIGWGGILKIGTDATEATLTEIAEVRSFNMPADESDEHEVTHMQSPGRRKEFIAGLIDAGEGSFTVNYVPGSATDLLLTDAAETGDTRSIQFIVPDQVGAPAWEVLTSGFVKKYAPDTVEPNAPITATATLRFTGAKTQAAPTP